jgi:hypothetical protein
VFQINGSSCTTMDKVFSFLISKEHLYFYVHLFNQKKDAMSDLL